jgi:hypothetical protein
MSSVTLPGNAGGESLNSLYCKGKWKMDNRVTEKVLIAITMQNDLGRRHSEYLSLRNEDEASAVCSNRVGHSVVIQELSFVVVRRQR